MDSRSSQQYETMINHLQHLLVETTAALTEKPDLDCKVFLTLHCQIISKRDRLKNFQCKQRFTVGDLCCC